MSSSDREAEGGDQVTKPISQDQIELSNMPEKEQRMTPKQRRFVIAYLTHFNGARAAREAGYSPRTANSIAYETLTKPHIQRYIKRHLESYALKTEEVIAKLGAMARGEIPTKTVERGGGPNPGTDVHYDEQLALEKLAKVLGLFVDHHTIERIDGLTIIEGDDVPPMLSDNGNE